MALSCGISNDEITWREREGEKKEEIYTCHFALEKNNCIVIQVNIKLNKKKQDIPQVSKPITDTT